MIPFSYSPFSFLMIKQKKNKYEYTFNVHKWIYGFSKAEKMLA